MSRVAVIGNSGGGKSTLARRIAALRALPLTEVDRLLWRAGWSLAPRSEYDGAHTEAINRSEWVIEGLGWQDSIPARLRRATEIVLIDMPLDVHIRLAADRHSQWKAGMLRHPPAGNLEPPTLNSLIETIHEVDRSWMPDIRESIFNADACGVAVTRITSLPTLDAFARQLAR